VKLKEVNTFYNEGSPIISPDGKTLYFFVDGHPQNTLGKEGTQDIWMSKKDDAGVWSAPKHLSSPYNQNKLNQVFNVLADGSVFIRGTRSKNAVGFSIVSPTGAWKELNIKDFDKMNKGQFWGASISADLKHMALYFSETAGSLRSDLYLSHMQPDGSWLRPVKMGISTNLDDFGPFISPDQKTLFFASDSPRAGRQGLIDIYKVARLDDTWNNWGPPVNVGKPLNTSAEDDYFSMDATGNIFVSRSNSKQDGGNLDIFILVPKNVHITLNGIVYNNKSKQTLAGSSVDVTVKDVKPVNLKSDAAGKFTTHLPETHEYSLIASAAGFQPYSSSFPLPKINSDTTINVEIFLNPNSKALVINGMVTNKKTGDPVDAKVSIAKRGDKAVNYKPATSGGAFSQEISKTGMYLFTASHEGFLNTTDSLNYDNDEVTPMTKNLVLQPIEVGVVVRLKNIYFDFNKATLKPESFVELQKVVAFLNENPTVEIEIEGHTDSVGPDDRNQKLSQDRSQSVVDYMVSKGISGGRLKAKGFGESKPIDTNDTDAGRANNRRVEFTVLKT
jgi:outer membrane protein OmpA-like peptidoglycan-associated protein